jgi:preprotein translocase subunit SecE
VVAGSNPARPANLPEDASGWDEMKDKLVRFFREVKVEMSKVSWPSLDELKNSTKVVIVAVILITVFIGVVDRILGWVIGQLMR